MRNYDHGPRTTRWPNYDTNKKWPTSDFPRGCGHTSEYVLYILKCIKRSSLWEKLTKIIEQWGHRKKAAPQLLPNLLQGIDNWRKGRDKTHTHIPPELSNNYYTQSIIGWPQELMVILYQNWSEVKHLYLQPLSAKVTYQRWISSLIKKLWDMAWDICNHHNHILHTSEGPVKNYLLTQNKPCKRNIWSTNTLPVTFPHRLPLSCQCLSWIS